MTECEKTNEKQLRFDREIHLSLNWIWGGINRNLACARRLCHPSFNVSQTRPHNRRERSLRNNSGKKMYVDILYIIWRLELLGIILHNRQKVCTYIGRYSTTSIVESGLDGKCECIERIHPL